jgi:nucleotide-binding universal stress UspA family protein
MIDTILVPLDGSELAEQILPYAKTLAAKTRAELVLLSAVVPVQTWLGASGTSARWKEEAEKATSYLESVRQQISAVGRVRTKVMWGTAAGCIRDTADTEGADLIAMTTHGRSGFPRLVMGSVAGEVLHTARQPVLLVRAGQGQPPGEVNIKRILVPVDGSPLSASVLPFIESVAQRLDADLILERVVTPPVILYPGEVIPSALPVLDEIEAEARVYLDKLGETVKRRGIKVQEEVSVGYPAQAILDAADRYSADLLAMSSHSRSAVGRWLIGSTTDAVVRQSHRPCLIVRPPAVAAMDPAGEETAAVEVASGVPAAKKVVSAPSATDARERGPRKVSAPAESTPRPKGGTR